MSQELPNPHKPHFRNDGVLHTTINRNRLHLRTSTSGEHLLWINGQQPPFLLDDTAADFVTHLIKAMWLHPDGKPAELEDYIVGNMYHKYGRLLAFGKKRVTRSRIKADFDRFFGILLKLGDGKCPAELGLGPKAINYAAWTAPARMDLAITYKCNLRCGKCYVGDDKSLSELSTEQWLDVFATLWKLGIPQVVFTGGEPTMREDLVELVGHADEFVTGLVTNGTYLAELAQSLSNASLDYAQVTIESFDPEIHDSMTRTKYSHSRTVSGIRKAQEVGIDLVTNTTLTTLNAPDFVKTLKWLHFDLGIKNVACNTLICSGRGTKYHDQHGIDGNDLNPILLEACRVADELGVNLQWYSPTCYSKLNPLALNFGPKSCSAAAHNMTVQPDGSVLPCQSWPTSIGNILKDDWMTIWNNPISKQLRAHSMAADECRGCDFLAQCGGGCPLDESSRTPTAHGGAK